MFNEDDIHLKLLANIPIDIDGIGQFQLPTIKEIIQMGESVYNTHLSLLLFSKDSMNDLTEYAKSLSDYELMLRLVSEDPTFRELLFMSFRLFLNSEPKMFENGLIYFDELCENTFLTDEKWKFVKKITLMGNFIQDKKEEEYKPGNERARKLMEKIKKQREEIEKLKKRKINLHSILSGVAWRTDGIDSLLNKTIYQLYDGYYRLGFVDNYNQIFTGIYTGNVDGSKIKLPDINWANIIKIN